MATILFAAAGAAVGSGFGGTVLGLSGAVLGRAVGATVGRALDQRIMGAGSEAVEIGRIDRFHVMGASEGAPIPKFWGRMRLAGQVIWASPFRETSQASGGKGMPSPKTVQYSYSVSLAIALGEGEILGIGRIWADGDEISPRSLNTRVYHGTEEQLPDPLIEAHMGDLAPAYRGTAYVVVDSLDLGAFGNRVPQFSFEVMRRAQGPEARKVPDLQDAIRAVALIPGTGEYALASQKIRFEGDLGVSRALNINSPSGDSDLITSLKQLKQELPNCRSVSLIVSWFGNDLRCASCEVQPKVEQTLEDAAQMPWRSGGIGRSQAQDVPRIDGMSVYGGTPSDESVIESIVALKSQGQSVMFYPFILMDQIEGNALADPYSDNAFQASLPWRGRITLSKAPGRVGSPDQTGQAVNEVAAFFGSANRTDFSIQDGKIQFNGSPEWRYRRFILHYAHLCHLAGGVDSFCIGSEMRGVTQIRGGDHRFPAVEALVQLAADVRAILGPDVKISYAADWSEYFGFHSGENVYFHLDPLWASSSIDFVGIDNYMPVSDWRDHSDHADVDWKSIYNIDYLKSNISGGEGYDWYYDSPEAVKAQLRTPIRDLAHNEHWVFRYKDIVSWWSLSHHNRIDGQRLDQPTAWVPGSKPIRFTEFGCPAIDMGTNEPNKFLDSKSSESAVPRSSLGNRDDFIQMQYFRASFMHWSDPANNPESDLYDGTMLDLDNCYAWAWDARPFPEFPRNLSAWSDGPNYDRGHWLNGRVTSVPLDRLVREVCEDSDSLNLNTERLYGAVHGYSAAENQSARAKLQPLSLAFSFDSFESEGIIKFQSRAAADVFEVFEDRFALRADGSSSLEISRGGNADSVARVRFSYLSEDGSFSAAVVEAFDPDSLSSSIAETEYPILLPVGVAKSTVNRWMVEAQLARDQISFGLPLSEGLGVLGSTVRVDGLSYRVDFVELDQRATIRAVRVEPPAGSTILSDMDPKPWHSHVEPASIFRLWMDLPLLTSDQVPHAPFLAVSSDPWLSPAILFSSNEDNGYIVNAKFERPCVVGRTHSDLAACRPGVIDRGPPLEIEVPLGSLESVSLLGLLSGMNLLAIGDGSPENWEVFQFMRADLVSPGRYRVSVRVRGVAGTDVLMPDVWPAGSYVVVLNDQVKQISLSSEHLNISRHYRLNSSASEIGSESGRHDIIAFQGIGLRPLSVSHLVCRVDSDESHRFFWIRRTRGGGDSWDGYDVPLFEERELYLFVVRTTQGEVLSSRVIEKTFFVYESEQRAEDGIYGEYYAEVSQISTFYGYGPRNRIVVPG